MALAKVTTFSLQDKNSILNLDPGMGKTIIMGCVAHVYANSLLSRDLESTKKVVILSPSKFMKESVNVSLPGWFNSNVVFVN